MDINQKIDIVQAYMQQHKIDGWLLYDYKGRNTLAVHFLEIPEGTMLTRSLYYWIPKKGEPVSLVHAVEADVVAHLPGEKKTYAGRDPLIALLKKELEGAYTIAMEYSPFGNIPNVSMVDGGTIQLIQSFGKTIISSGDFLQEVLCILSEEQVTSHKYAARVIRDALDQSWQLIRQKGIGLTELEVQQGIQGVFEKNQCTFEGGPIVAFGPNGANPHYEVPKKGSRTLREGDTILIDLWCKQKSPGAVYADVTEMGVFSSKPSARQQEVFDVVFSAQDKAAKLLFARYEKNQPVQAFELDQVAREQIETAGFGKYFTHRLGHNIYTMDHGPGANLDSFESHDVRQLIRGTCFSIEPGVYIPGDIGVRLELDIYIPPSGAPLITTGQQKEYILLK